MRNRYILIIPILAFGLALRLILLSSGINLDDTITLYVAKSADLPELFQRTIDFEFGPPLYFIIMHFWINLFGESMTALAAPSTALGVLLIFFTYQLAYDLTKCNKTALFAGYFAAISPLAIFLSHEARTYSLLACLSTCVIWAFYKTQVSYSLKFKITLLISSTLLFYTHYVGFVFCATMISFFFLFLAINKKTDQYKNLLFAVGILAISALLFIPGLPILKEHLAHGVYWDDKTDLSRWPEVFASNIAACLPLPWLHGFVLVFAAAPLTLIYCLYIALKAKGQSFELIKNFTSDNIFYLSMILLFVVTTFGFLTPFIIGYCRYLIPFAVLAWIVLAAVYATLFTSSKKLIRYLVVLVMIFLGADATHEIYKLASTDRNGLRQLARDIKQEKYKDCAFLLTPDFDSYTLMYFLKEEQQMDLPEAYFTYPRPNERKPARHEGYPEAWRDKAILDKLLNDIELIDKSKYKFLVVVVDDDIFDSKLMPVETRIEELLQRLSTKYKKVKPIKSYESKGRSFTVHKFILSG